MVVKEMVAHDLKHCYGVLQEDKLINSLEHGFYELGKEVDADVFTKMEELFSEYGARMARIGYVQGLKDFEELCLVLKEDTSDILRKYIDADTRTE